LVAPNQRLTKSQVTGPSKLRDYKSTIPSGKHNLNAAVGLVFSRLQSYDRTNIGAQTYTYNGLGDRVRVVKPTGTRHFVYDSQGRVVAEYGTSPSDVKAEFIWALPPAANDNSPFGGDDGIVGYAPLALVTTNTSSQLTLYWVHGNHLGVPIVTTNALGQVVDPGNDFLRPGFPGQSQVLSDLYYNRARDYDPVLGRYIQADPIGLLGDVNPYVYAGADPVNMMDPDGELAWWVIPAILAGGNLLYQLYMNDGNVNCVDPWEVGGWALSGTGFSGIARIGMSGGGRAFLRELWKDSTGSVPRALSSRGMNNPNTRQAVERGRQAHREFADRVRQKSGWRSNPMVRSPSGKKLFPDAVTRSGRPIELKPNTPSGIRRGLKQLREYEQATGKKGRLILYEP
jgi:RHS repeat-associated protein